MSNFCYVSVEGCNMKAGGVVADDYNLLQIIKVTPGASRAGFGRAAASSYLCKKLF